MSIFIGLRMDESSVNIILKWLRRCTAENQCNLINPVPRQFLYLPLAYTGNSQVSPATISHYLAGSINVPITLGNPQVRSLGEMGNVSVVFESEWIRERRKYWESIDANIQFKKSGKKYLCRFPMSYQSRNLNYGWLKSLPIREITLVEEFATDFDPNAFLKEIKNHY